jgi:hypothetical protein
MSENSNPNTSEGTTPDNDSGETKPKIKEEKGTIKPKDKPRPWQPKKKFGSFNSQSNHKVTETSFKGTITEMNGHTFQCHGESNTASQFSRTCEELQRYCLQKYKYGDDVAFVVRHFKEYDMKKNKPEAAPKDADAIDLRIVDKEVDEYVKRKSTYKQNIKSLYMVTWAQCSNAMQAKIKSLKGFDTFDEERNFLTLIQAIKGVSYKFEAQRYPPLALFEAKLAFYRYQQHRTLSNADYLERFKALYTVIFHYGGSIGEDPMLVRDEARRDNVRDHATLKPTDAAYIARVPASRNRFLAFAFLQGSDKSRFGELVIELENQHTYGNDNFPPNLTMAYNLLINYRSMHKKKQDHKHEEKKDSEFAFNIKGVEAGVKCNSKGVPLKCYRCGGAHYTNDPDCPKAPDKIGQVKTYSAALLSSEPDLQSSSSSPPIEQSSTHNFVMNVIDAPNTNEGLDRRIELDLDDNEEDNSTPSYGDLCFSIMPLILKNTKSGWLNDNFLILDTGSTVTIFKNPKLLTDIYNVPPQKQLTVFCNSGKQNMTFRGNCPGLGEVWHNTASLANIVSFSLLTDLFPVDYDQQNQQFICRISDNKSIAFKRKGGLYVYDATPIVSSNQREYLFIQTISKNKLLFSEEDVSRAEHARKLYITLGRPSFRSFRWMLLHNRIDNTDLTSRDADNAEKIFGPDIGTLRGKTTRRKPKQVNIPSNTPIGIPDDILAVIKNVTLCADIFYVDQLKFLVTLSRNIHFGTVEFIINRKHDTILQSLTNAVNLYKYFKYKVMSLLTDSEFYGLRNQLLHQGVLLNTAAAHEHVGDIERYIRVIKERVRAIITTLPFSHFPRLLRREIIYFAVSAINHTIRQTGIIPNQSPTSIITGQVLDALKNCVLPFATFCHIGHYNEPRNDTDSARTVDALALRPTGNAQGGYFFMRLDTWKRVSRHTWIELPMSDETITLINDHGKTQTPTDDVFIFKRSDKSFLTSLAISDDHLVCDHPQDEGASITNDQQQNNDEDNASENISHHSNADPDSDDDSDIIDEQIDSDTDSHVQHDNTLEEPLRDTDSLLSYSDDNSENISISDTSHNEVRSATDSHESTDSLDQAIHNIDSTINPDNIITTTTNESRPGTRRYNMRPSQNASYNEKELKNNAFTLHITSQQQNLPKSPPSLSWDYQNKFAYAFTQMSAREGLRRFGDKAADALISEWKQLDEKKVFHGVHFKDTSYEQRSKALRLVQLIKQKRCGKIKGRTCADGRKQKEYIKEEDSTSPTVSTEALLLTLMIDANEHRDVATADVPGAFLHSDMDEETFVVVDGALVDLLIQSNNKYAEYIHITKEGKKLVFLKLDKALYGTVKAARLFFENLSGKLSEYGFESNPYDMCIMNKMINNKQCTVAWHVDDLKISHADSKVVDELLEYLSSIYGELSITRGDRHTYVGMDFYFPGDGTVKIDMSTYLKEALDEFPDTVDKLVTSPASNHIFDVDPTATPLNEERRELLHHLVAKLLFVSTRARPDIHLPISFLTSRVSKADTDDWKKLQRLMQYIHHTIDLQLTLSASNMSVVKWWVDVAYGVRSDYKSQTGRTMSLGKGTIMSHSTKQKLNTKSSTESELVGASDSVPQIVWTNYFLTAQGYALNDTILFQDNTSAISMETNGKLSSGKQTKHINIRYFFIQDRIKNKEISVKYCPTDQMLADYFTKPLQGAKFTLFRDMILGISNIDFTK